MRQRRRPIANGFAPMKLFAEDVCLFLTIKPPMDNGSLDTDDLGLTLALNSWSIEFNNVNSPTIWM